MDRERRRWRRACELVGVREGRLESEHLRMRQLRAAQQGRSPDAPPWPDLAVLSHTQAFALRHPSLTSIPTHPLVSAFAAHSQPSFPLLYSFHRSPCPIAQPTMLSDTLSSLLSTDE